jgi:hypothetical protein
MEQLNRWLGVVFGLLLLCSGLIIALGALLVAGPYTITLSTGEQWNLSRLAPSDQIVALVIGVPILLLGTLLCALELLGPPRQRRFTVSKDAQGRVEIETASVTDRLKADLMHVPQLINVEPKVLQGPAGIDVQLGMTVAQNANVPSVVDSAVAAARATLEQELGLRVKAVHSTVQLAEQSSVNLPSGA